MRRNWLLVIVAAVFEVVWVAGMKHAETAGAWTLTVIAVLASFGLLIYSSGRLPTTTVYAVFVGLGTAGTVLAEMLWFQVPFHWAKALLIVLLLIGIIGLKAVSASPEQPRDAKDAKKDRVRGELR